MSLLSQQPVTTAPGFVNWTARLKQRPDRGGKFKERFQQRWEVLWKPQQKVQPGSESKEQCQELKHLTAQGASQEEHISGE